MWNVKWHVQYDTNSIFLLKRYETEILIPLLLNSIAVNSGVFQITIQQHHKHFQQRLNIYVFIMFIIYLIYCFNNEFFFGIGSLIRETMTKCSRRSGTIFLLFNIKANDAEYEKLREIIFQTRSSFIFHYLDQNHVSEPRRGQGYCRLAPRGKCRLRRHLKPLRSN